MSTESQSGAESGQPSTSGNRFGIFKYTNITVISTAATGKNDTDGCDAYLEANNSFDALIAALSLHTVGMRIEIDAEAADTLVFDLEDMIMDYIYHNADPEEGEEDDTPYAQLGGEG